MTVMRSLGTGILSELDVDVAVDAPLGPATWYGIGGRADLIVRPRTVAALSALVARCHRSGTPLRVLGSGANLLVDDEGVDGIVVRLDAEAFGGSTDAADPDGVRLEVGAGADLARLVMHAAREGWTGLEPMAGVPASVGGAIRMNAGGRWGAIGDVVEAVTLVARDGAVVVRSAAEAGFGYRETALVEPVVLAATLRLREDDPLLVRERVKEIFRDKKSTQPLAEHSAGCAFRNPIDPVSERRVSAGALIDRAGLKGLRIGGAEISRHHANFIVAHPGASATDVIMLMDEVARRVLDHAGIALEREVVVWRRGEA